MSPEQREAARIKAGATRAEHARISTQLANRETTLAAVLEKAHAEPDTPAGAMRARRVVTSLPGIGASRGQAILTTAKVPAAKRLRGLGSRQRHALLTAAGST
jgi:guanylate kinase